MKTIQQYSINTDDCLTCAFVNASKLDYGVVYESIKITSNILQALPDHFFNFKKVFWLWNLGSKEPMVVVIDPTGEDDGLHAVAMVNGVCYDNSKGSSNNGLTFLQLSLKYQIYKVWRR